MEAMLSIYLRGPKLEDLPYVSGYCGEFHDGISQQAGPRLIPGMSVLLLYIIITTDGLSDPSGFFDDSNDRARRRRRDALDREAALYRARDTAPQPTSAAYTRIRRRVSANAIAGPSTRPVPANAIAGPSTPRGNGEPGESEMSPTQMETDILTRLANGAGISQYDALGFLETCTRCGNFFLRSFLGRHLTSCVHK
jgi:hypothetical protein